MKPKEFQRLIDRDSYCLHCGEREAISPNHRKNRGMGGSKLGNKASNLIVLCSLYNGQIESNPDQARFARQMGWKIESWEDPASIPVCDSLTGLWWYLTDDYQREPESPLRGV
jgi:hypothetical protein